MPTARILILSTALLALVLVSFLPSALPTAVAEEEKKSDENFVLKALDWVEVADPIVTDKIVLFPLVVPRPVGDIGVDAIGTGESVEFAEPELPKSRYDVSLKNGRDRPVLVVGGTILEGGTRDRLVRQSAIVGASSEADIRTLPASTSSERRKVAEPFKVSDTLAPIYLRKKAEYDGTANTVTTFIARWLDFREDDDDRKSLIAIATAPKLKAFCLPCHEAAARFPRTEGSSQQVVGAVAVVRGRIQGLIVYGNNDLVRDSFPAMLRGATYPAAAIELRAEKAGIPLPGADEDADELLSRNRKEIDDLLKQVRKATYREDDVGKGQLGEALILRTGDSTRGRALGLDGVLVQLVVYPHDPFESALYGTALDVPDEDMMEDDERAGLAGLARRAGQSGRRLTEAEKRLLERLRNPNPGANPPVLPRGPGGLPRR